MRILSSSILLILTCSNYQVQSEPEINIDGLKAEFLELVQNISAIVETEIAECGDAIEKLGNILNSTDTDVCNDLFDDVTAYVSNFESPEPSFENDGLSLTFKVPENLGNTTEWNARLDEACISQSGCVPTLDRALDEIDRECRIDQLGLLPGEVTSFIKIIRSMVKTVCVRDEDDGNAFCIPKLFDELNNFDLFDVSFNETSFNETRTSARNTLCSSCSLSIQKTVVPVLGPAANMFYTASQLLCLRDLIDDSYCELKDLVDGTLHAFKYELRSFIPERFYNASELCDSSCKTQAVALFAPSILEEDDEDDYDIYYPKVCYEDVENRLTSGGSGGESNGSDGSDSNDDDDYYTITITIPGLNSTTVETWSLRAFLRSLRQDLAVAFRTAVDFINVTIVENENFEWLTIEVKIEKDFIGAPPIAKEEMAETVQDATLTKSNMLTNVTNLVNPTRVMEADIMSETPTPAPVGGSEPTSGGEMLRNTGLMVASLSTFVLAGV